VQTPLDGVTVDATLDHEYSVEAHDMQSLFFAFLDELLFIFSTELFIADSVHLRN